MTLYEQQIHVTLNETGSSLYLANWKRSGRRRRLSERTEENRENFSQNS